MAFYKSIYLLTYLITYLFTYMSVTHLRTKLSVPSILSDENPLCVEDVLVRYCLLSCVRDKLH